MQATYFRSIFQQAMIALALVIGLSCPAVSQDAEPSQIDQGLAALESQDFAAASEHFSAAFDEGTPDGAFYLGRMLELGLGGAPNLRAAVGLYTAGSAKGSASSQNRLGVLHIQGNGVLQDYARGAELICEAAAQDDVNGLFNCGSLMLEGRGVEKDEVRAYEMLKQAADRGHLSAKNEYASALIDGKFVEKDIAAALQLFEATADAGHPVGLFALGQAYAMGLGVDPNLIRAHSFLNVSAALGHPEAAEARAALEQEMSADDVLQAQEMARSWRPGTQNTAAEAE